MMLMMVVAMVMAMAKIFAFRFYISKLPINRLRGRYVRTRIHTFLLGRRFLSCLDIEKAATEISRALTGIARAVRDRLFKPKG